MTKEYIEREKALEKVIEVKHHDPEFSGVVLHRYIKEIDLKDIPAADVMEVIRCRECVHWKPIGSKVGNPFSDMEYIGGCEFTKYCRRESDFCSYGELKEGAD